MVSMSSTSLWAPGLIYFMYHLSTTCTHWFTSCCILLATCISLWLYMYVFLQSRFQSIHFQLLLLVLTCLFIYCFSSSFVFFPPLNLFLCYTSICNGHISSVLLLLLGCFFLTLTGRMSHTCEMQLLVKGTVVTNTSHAISITEDECHICVTGVIKGLDVR